VQLGLSKAAFLCQYQVVKQKKFEIHRKKLQCLKQQLLSDSKSTYLTRKPVELDQTTVGRLSRIDALQVQAMQVETERRRKIGLQRIAGALKRLAEETFGDCLICGEKIEVRRLNHDPTVTSCITCARESR
tara:strand:- start:5763 stop:6155 length:393 start_codon:yes stop_codon:yes gene_type:complete